MSQLYCNVADMAALADSVYDESQAYGTAFPALPAVPKISKNLAAYFAGMLVIAPYAARVADRRADGLAEAHADAVYKFLNQVDDASFTALLQRKLTDWYAAAPKMDRHAPSGDDADEGAPGEEKAEGGGVYSTPNLD